MTTKTLHRTCGGEIAIDQLPLDPPVSRRRCTVCHLVPDDDEIVVVAERGLEALASEFELITQAINLGVMSHAYQTFDVWYEKGAHRDQLRTFDSWESWGYVRGYAGALGITAYELYRCVRANANNRNKETP